MKKVEIESFIKSFLLFFISQSILVAILFFLDYKKDLQSFEDELFNKMRVCSFDLKCKDLDIDFAKKGEFELYKLYKDKDSISSYFLINHSDKYILKISLKKERYLKEVSKIKLSKIYSFLIVLIFIILLSVVFSIYALYPFKKSLNLTQEFVKDILHDFNTPLSTLRLNVAMLKNSNIDSKKLTRIENSVETILHLQANLRAYLNEHKLQKEEFSIKEVLLNSVEQFRSSDIEFFLDIEDKKLYMNKDAFVRVVDNLISNAVKYNKKGGFVKIIFKDSTLEIIDSGRGIKNPKKVFDRFYKEHERGIGIGLHIVKKLCDELNIKIEVSSKDSVGSRFVLKM